jgi:hypothetical protein
MGISLVHQLPLTCAYYHETWLLYPEGGVPDPLLPARFANSIELRTDARYPGMSLLFAVRATTVRAQEAGPEMLAGVVGEKANPPRCSEIAGGDGDFFLSL